MLKLRKNSIFFFLCFTTLCSFVSHKAVSSSEKYKAQSIFVYTFTKYVNWSKSQPDRFTIVSYKNSGINPYLQQIAATKKIKEKSVSIVLIDPSSDIPDCDLIYFDDQNAKLAATHMAKRSMNNILVVSQSGHAEKTLENINLFEANDSYKFDINLENIEKNGMTVSSNLLKLASKTHD